MLPLRLQSRLRCPTACGKKLAPVSENARRIHTLPRAWTEPDAFWSSELIARSRTAGIIGSDCGGMHGDPVANRHGTGENGVFYARAVSGWVESGWGIPTRLAGSRLGDPSGSLSRRASTHFDAVDPLGPDFEPIAREVMALARGAVDSFAPAV